MSFQNIDASRKVLKQPPTSSTQNDNKAEDGNRTDTTSSTQSLGRLSNNSTLVNLGDSINQLLRNVAILGTLADTAITGDVEQKMQYEVQDEVTSDISSRIKKNLTTFNNSVLSNSRGDSGIPRSEIARLRSQYYKLEKDYHSVLNSKGLITEKVNRRRDLIKARCSQNVSSNNNNNNNNNNEINLPPSPPNQNQQQQQQQQLIQQQDHDIVAERSAALQGINKDMRIVNEIFKDLALIVNEQQDDIDNIENLVEASHEHSKAGLEQIQKANEYQQGCVLS